MVTTYVVVPLNGPLFEVEAEHVAVSAAAVVFHDGPAEHRRVNISAADTVASFNAEQLLCWYPKGAPITRPIVKDILP